MSVPGKNRRLRSQGNNFPSQEIAPAQGSKVRLIELKEDRFVYCQNKLKKGAKIPE